MRSSLIWLGIVVALSSTSCGSSDAAGSAPTADAGAAATSFGPPPHKAGESWTYRATTTLVSTPADSPPPADITTFVDIGGDRGAYIARVVQGNSTVQLTVNVDGQVVAVDKCSFTPAVNYITFPLEVGRTWTIDYTSCSGTHTTGTGEVVGKKTIATAAFGDVETLEIHTKSTSTSKGDPENGVPASTNSNSSVVHWAPKLGIHVKEQIDVPATETSSAVVVVNELTQFVPAK